MNGIIVIYKEKGYTSHDVVAKLRGIFKQKKIGHTGTLDPDAEGVLPVCLGNATKLCDMITAKEKAYRAVLLLGQATDTQDISGKVINSSDLIVNEQEIRAAINHFIGEYDQVPPMYSAIKINGKKMYELARAGIEVERPARKVTIHNIIINEIKDNRVSMDVFCSKGTYIRTLCNDIGEYLKTYGCMESLLRIQSGEFILENALKLSQVEEYVRDNSIEEHIMSVDSVFQDLPSFSVEEIWNKLLNNGNRMPAETITEDVTELNDGDLVRIYNSEKTFVGVYKYMKNNQDFKPEKLFF